MKLDAPSTVERLFNDYEINDGGEQYEAELRPVSARIPIESHVILEAFAVRWGRSKSSLAAELLEASLDELELLRSGLELKKAEGAAL
jgi:hypothetical protein